MSRILDQVVGHQDVIENFLNAFEHQRLGHSYLFVGPSGVGKKMTALGLAQALLCEKSPRACGVCGSCLRTQKPPTESLLVIEPVKNLIKIEQAEQVLQFLQLRSLSPRRVVIIDEADALNPQAANSLLKVIEEPPAGTVFFLIAPSTGHVLRTIRSRSQALSFGPLTVDEMKKRSPSPEWALRASQGSFERLAQLSQKEELEIRESAMAWLRDWMAEPQGFLKTEHRDMVRDRSVAQSLGQHLSWLLRDVAYFKTGGETLILNMDQKKFIQELSEKLSADQVFHAAQKSLQIQSQLESNFDAALVFERFWLETRPAQARPEVGRPAQGLSSAGRPNV